MRAVAERDGANIGRGVEREDLHDAILPRSAGVTRQRLRDPVQCDRGLRKAEFIRPRRSMSRDRANKLAATTTAAVLERPKSWTPSSSPRSIRKAAASPASTVR